MTWRQSARKLIEAAIAQAKAEGKDKAGIKQAVDETWQFGERKNYPYQMWLQERKLAFYLEGIITISEPPANVKTFRRPSAKKIKQAPGQLPLF